MIDDLENEILQEEEGQEESTSNKFTISLLYHPILKHNQKILSMSASKRFIYLITDNSELLRIDSQSLKPVLKSISIPESQNTSQFKEDLTKIWSDRCGYHNIIRYKGSFFYYNSCCLTIKEIKSFKNIEICAIGLDDRNTDEKNTNNFIAVDYSNNIYECNIKVDKLDLDGDCEFRDRIELMASFNFFDWDYDEEEYISRSNVNERVYDIKFFRGTKFNIQPNEDALYIIAVTKNRFYQFTGPGLTSFRQIFGRYKNDPLLFNDSCKIFPTISTKKEKTLGTSINLLYKSEKRNTGDNKTSLTEVYNQFGWKTQTGFCFGSFKYDNNPNSSGLPFEQNRFTVMPFSKINREGCKINGEEPIDILHTNNHIFLLYEDSLTVISKLTSYIIHTQYFKNPTEFKQLLYNEFFENNGVILLNSENGLYQVSLKDENIDVWKDYLEIGDFKKAQLFCPSEKLKQRIYRIEAEYQFKELKDGFNAANKYANSDEKFEIVCLEYLLKNDIDGLTIYLQLYMESNLNKLDENSKNEKKEEKKNEDEDEEDKSQDESKKDKVDILQLSLICTWLIEIFLNQLKGTNDKSNLFEFRQTIRENRKYICPPLIYELLQNYGRLKEYTEFGSLMSDYERVILYYLDNGEVDAAIKQIEFYLVCTDDETTIKIITKIFCDYSPIFFKKNPKKSISILQQNLKELKMELIVHAIASTTDNDNYDSNLENLTKKEIAAKLEKNHVILEFLKTLIDKPKIEQENNIHNLYIYFLSRSKGNHQSLIDYLKAPLKIEENDNIYFTKKKGILCNLDYAKKLFKKNSAEYALVLALMGKYSGGIKAALDGGTEECQQIAKFIASNAPGERLKKSLWIQIFCHNSQNEIKQALEIMKESKLLKIEDVLPYITDNITIENFKLQISDCIKEYTNNINTLKENINDYNIIAENIKVDIKKIKKNAMEVTNNDCSCAICQKPIEDRKLFLFPCGHIFDIYCMKECLLEYEITGIDYLHDKNVEIDDLFQKLGFSNDRIFSKVVKENENEDKLQENNLSRNISKKTGHVIGLKRVKNYKTINNLKRRLYGLLGEQCVLCGDFLVDSVQYTLDQKDVFKPDKNGFKLKIEKEFDFEF